MAADCGVCGDMATWLAGWRAEEFVIAREKELWYEARRAPDWHDELPSREEFLRRAEDRKGYRELEQYMLGSLKLATLRDYDDWLIGFLATGGKPTHAYDYPFRPGDEWCVATRDFNSAHMCGASAKRVIVPVGINILSTICLGHNEYYFMDGFRREGGYSVPTFADSLTSHARCDRKPAEPKRWRLCDLWRDKESEAKEA